MKGRAFAVSYLTYVYNAATATTDTSGIFAAAGTATAFYVGLFTASASATDSQTTNEISYTGYSRIPVARTSTGWTISTSAGTVSPFAAITFGNMSAGAGGTAVAAVIGTASSGAGQIVHSGALSPSIVVSNGSTPQLTATSVITGS